MRNTPLQGPYSRDYLGSFDGTRGGEQFFMSEVPVCDPQER